MLLQLTECFLNGCFQGFDLSEEVVVQSGSFQVAPEPFDQVQLRAVRRQPDYEDVVRVLSKQSPYGLRSMVAGIVNDQRQSTLRVRLQELSQELAELL